MLSATLNLLPVRDVRADNGNVLQPARNDPAWTAWFARRFGRGKGEQGAKR